MAATFTADSTRVRASSTDKSAGGGETLVGRDLGKVVTQYREAERLTGYLRGVLELIQEAARACARIPSFFDIDTAVGEQLTFLGKRLGFPRCHCVCDATPVFGFACVDPVPGPPVVGFCEDGTWRGCGGVSELCLGDDEVYRTHLVARRYQMLGLYDLPSLGAALRAVWGPTAWVPEARRGRIVVAPGRALTSAETRRFAVTLRALPVAPTMEIAVHYGAAPIAGFGTGWAGFRAAGGGPGGHWLCPTVVDPYACGDPPLQAVVGFEGADDGRPVAGFGDDDATWLACL